MKKLLLVFLLISLQLLVASIPAHSGSSLTWTKPRVKMLSWPSKGRANLIPAYAHLSSPSEDYLNFSYCPDAKYSLKDGGVEVKIGNSVELIKSADKLTIPLALPGAERRVSFEVFPPNDAEHYGSDVDKLQWKIRNPNAMSFALNGVELIFLDADANGVFFDQDVDLVANLESSRFTKGEFDPAVIKWTPFTGVFLIGSVVYLVSIDSKGTAYSCEFPTTFDQLHAQAFALLNDVRAQHGLDPVLPDPELSELLTKHCTYCANVEVKREENPKSYYYDAAAAKVARYSFTTPAVNAPVGMKAALCTLFARNMLLYPSAKSFGMAVSDGFFCIGGVKAAWEADFQPFYPCPGQRRVFQRYVLEDPSALRTGEDAFCGTFVVLGGLKPSAVLTEAIIEDVKNGPLKISVSSPVDPPNDKVRELWADNRKGIIIISNEPLRTSTIYRVQVKYKQTAEETDKLAEWLFMTDIPPRR